MVDLVDPRLKASEIVTVQLEASVYTAPRELLLSRSAFFRERLIPSKEATTPPVVRKDGPRFLKDAWRHYATYFSLGRISTPSVYNGHYLSVGDFSELINLFLLGEHVNDTEFQDDVMDALLARYGEGQANGKPYLPTDYTLSKANEHTPPGSPLRKFIVDVHVWAKSVRPNGERSHEQFLEDLRSAMMKQSDAMTKAARLSDEVNALMGNGELLAIKLAPKPKEPQSGIPANVSCCDYHLHKSGGLCGNKKRKRAAEEAEEAGGDVRSTTKIPE